jgi:amino acid adenylation domain-containing protein
LEFGSESWTYRRLNEAANRVARAVLECQLPKGNPVALLFGPGIGALAGILGVLKAGRAWIPIVPQTPRERARLLFSEARSRLLLTDALHIEMATTLVGDVGETMSIEGVIDSGAGDNLDLRITPDTMANIIFTSGSTGRPKGVVHTHGSILNNIMVHTNSLGITYDDRFSQTATYAALAGISSIFRALLNGATLLPFDAASYGVADLASWLIRERVTVCQIVPTLFRLMIQSLDGNGVFSDMRVLHLGGEPVYRQDVLDYRRHFPKTSVLVHNLGSSEAPTIRQFFVHHDTPIAEDRIPVGYSVTDREVILVDEHGTPVGFEEVGEIVVKGRYLAQGYWCQPELTRRMFRPDPSGDGTRRFYTGDLGSMRRDGCLTHLGRKDSQVKIHGYRVELGEIESILMSMPGIDQAAVVGYPEVDGGALTAYVVLAPGQHLAEETICKQLQEKLPKAVAPRRVIIQERLPLTQTGKIDRKALLSELPKVHVLGVAPADPIEKQLCLIWSEVLGLQVGTTDNFFDLGGDSLSGGRILHKMAANFGITVPMEVLFERPTVSAMVQWLHSLINR